MGGGAGGGGGHDDPGGGAEGGGGHDDSGDSIGGWFWHMWHDLQDWMRGDDEWGVETERAVAGVRG